MFEAIRNLARTVLALIGRLLLSLRYRIEVRGLEEIRRRGTAGVLFLPSHLALIDPDHPHGRARPLVPPAARWPTSTRSPARSSGSLARLFGARALPNMERQGLAGDRRDASGARRDRRARCAAGENLLFYPAGRLRHGRPRGDCARRAAPTSSSRPCPRRASSWSGRPGSGAAASAARSTGELPRLGPTLLARRRRPPAQRPRSSRRGATS